MQVISIKFVRYEVSNDSNVPTMRHHHGPDTEVRYRFDPEIARGYLEVDMRFMVAKERTRTTVSTPPWRYICINIQQLGDATVAGSSVEFSILNSRRQRWWENEAI